MKAYKARKGSVLIEALVSLAVFSIALSAVATSVVVLAELSRKQFERTQALTVAENVSVFYRKYHASWETNFLTAVYGESYASYFVDEDENSGKLYFDAAFLPVQEDGVYKMGYALGEEEKPSLTLSFAYVANNETIINPVTIAYEVAES